MEFKKHVISNEATRTIVVRSRNQSDTAHPFLRGQFLGNGEPVQELGLRKVTLVADGLTVGGGPRRLATIHRESGTEQTPPVLDPISRRHIPNTWHLRQTRRFCQKSDQIRLSSLQQSKNYIDRECVLSHLTYYSGSCTTGEVRDGLPWPPQSEETRTYWAQWDSGCSGCTGDSMLPTGEA